MNLARAFAKFMEDNGYGTFGEDLFIGGVPQNAPNSSWWISFGGGFNLTKNRTGEKQKNYVINIYFRSLDGELVYNELQELEELLNSNTCLEIDGYTITEIEASLFPTDQDLDNEDRTVGTIQATITVYSS
jgi:hypothetical protein